MITYFLIIGFYKIILFAYAGWIDLSLLNVESFRKSLCTNKRIILFFSNGSKIRFDQL